MKLSKATIQNFRSIKHLEIDFQHGSQILLGINESGKSNILRALHLLDPDVTAAHTDLRIERTHEDQVTEGSVFFEFQLNDSEISKIYEEISVSFDPASLEKYIIESPTGKLTLRAFTHVRCRMLHEIKIPSNERRTNYWALPKGRYSILPGWARTGATHIELAAEEGKSLLLPANTIAFIGENHPDLKSFTEPLSPDLINSMIGAALLKNFSNQLPKCIFWKYSDAYLLPSSIDVASFSANPNSCVPLRSIFELAGYKSSALATIIPEAQAHSQHRYFSLLRKASEAATKHIRRVWKDHKSIRIDLQPNGSLLVPLVIDDQVPLDMAARSDGFKRFASFLLQISAKVHTTEFKDALLLVDEPEIALHPGGARSLMKELTEIGESNAVIYSTHSIFMVDRDNIGRHLIIEKKDEVTSARKAEKSRIQDEEVLYAAMGYSIFETLKKKNVIFEGWRDKEIFRVARDAAIKLDKTEKTTLLDLGLTFAEGVKDVRTVAKILELAGRDFLIVSDSDAAALARRKEYQKPGASGNWLTLNEILGPGIATTGEDLFHRDALIKRANKFRATVENLPLLSDADFPGSQPAMSALKTWLAKSDAGTDENEENLKRTLYENLKREELIDNVNDLVEFVKNYDFKTAP